MSAMLKIFIAILSISILLQILVPASTSLIEGGLFDEMLTKGTDQNTGEEVYDGFDNEFSNPSWSGETQEDSSFFQKVLDVLSVAKGTIITLINIAVLPIQLALGLQMPLIIRTLFFIPLALLYIISAIITLVRGVTL